MKKNEFMQIKGSDLKELKSKIRDLRSEIANLILDKNMNKLKDVKMISKKKKDLARILTVMRQKELLQELELKVQKDSEGLRKPESQNTRESDNQNNLSSDISGTPSHSEFSEKPKHRLKKGVRK